MERRYRTITFLTLAVFLAGLLMPACSLLTSPKQTETEAVPVTSPESTETEAVPVISPEQAEELVAFMLEYIQQEEVPYAGEVNIIMWGHVKEGSPPEIYYVSELIKVWWLENGQLSEREDKIEAIEQYRQDYVRDQDFDATWGEFEFGILSISEDGRQAQIVLEASIRIDYAYAILFTLERDEAGQWEITASEHLWIV
jgi:hypothetical protein